MTDPVRADVSAFRRAAAALGDLGDGLDAVLEAEGALEAADVSLPILEASPFGALPEIAELRPGAESAAPDAPTRRSAAPTPPAAPRPTSRSSSRGSDVPAAPVREAAPAPSPARSSSPPLSDRERSEAESTPVFPVARGRRRPVASSADGPAADESPAPRAAAGVPAADFDAASVDFSRDESTQASASGDGSRAAPPSRRTSGTRAPATVSPDPADAPAAVRTDGSAWADPAALVAAILSAAAANGVSAGDDARTSQPWRGAVRAFRGVGRGLGAMPDGVGELLGAGAAGDVVAMAEAPLPLGDESPFDAVSADAVPQPRERGKDRRHAAASAKRREWPEPPAAPVRRSPTAPDAPRRDPFAPADTRGSGAGSSRDSRDGGPVATRDDKGTPASAPQAETTASDARPVHRLGRRPAARAEDAAASSTSERSAARETGKGDAPSASNLSRYGKGGEPRRAGEGAGAARATAPADRAGALGRLAADPLERTARAGELDRLGSTEWESRGGDGGEEPRTLLADLSRAVLRVGRGENGRVARRAAESGDGERTRTRGQAPPVPQRPAATRADAGSREASGAGGETPRRAGEPVRRASGAPEAPRAAAGERTSRQAPDTADAPRGTASGATHPSAPVAGSRAGRAPAVGAAPRVGRSLRLIDTLARSILAARGARETALASQASQTAATPSPDGAVRGATAAPEIALAPRTGGWSEVGHAMSVASAAAAPDAAVTALDAALHADAGLPAASPIAPGAARSQGFGAMDAIGEQPLNAGIDAQAGLDAGALASLVNDALVEQALRHGVDLS